jgi:dihydroorotate dehydrogenase electron transfer subunit
MGAEMQNVSSQNSSEAEKVQKKGPFQLKILENIEIAENIYRMTLEGAEITQTAVPGQFVSVKCDDLVLRRPFSVARVDGITFDLLYKIKGVGTKFMTDLKQGGTADVIGPLGNGFRIEDNNPLIIGCGVGIAPIEFLSDVLKAKGIVHKTMACFRNKYNSDRDYDYYITEDGSSKIKGSLKDHFERVIQETSPGKICICGPNPAMRYVTEIALKNSIDVEVALEGEFACGTGVCMGCSIRIMKDGKASQARICKDGPVFKGEVIIWE